MKVFISYRREGGSTQAQLLEVLLRLRGYDVFLDRRSLNSYDGYFDTQIISAIASADCLLLVLSPGALDRCDNPQDWLRREITHAMKCGVTIVPVMMMGFTWPDALPEDIADVQRCHAHTFYDEYRDACMDRICENLVERRKPEAVRPVDLGAFPGEDCDIEALKQAERVEIPMGYTSIRDKAFAGWEKLTHITIPNSVTDIGESAFECCGSLTDIRIPKSVTGIGRCAFQCCESLTNVSIPSGVTRIEAGVFENCVNLTSVSIPPSVTDVGEAAFAGCESLMDVSIPSGVTGIGDYAFEGCISLTSITLPAALTGIGKDAFPPSARIIRHP